MHLVLSPRAELVRGALCSNFKQKFRGQTGRTRQDFGALSPNCTNTDACQGPQGRTHLMSLCPVLVSTFGISGPAMAAAAAVTGKLKETGDTADG